VRQSIELGNHQGRAVPMTRVDERHRYCNAPAAASPRIFGFRDQFT
jgi:hypothetical protein